MKTPESIKNELKKYGSGEEWDVSKECAKLCKRAFAYIKRLESVASNAVDALGEAERERDAAVADLSNSCSFCKHLRGSVDEPPCTDCFHPKNNNVFAPITRTKFEWRGVCPENTKEAGDVEKKAAPDP